MRHDGLSEEIKERARTCESPEELLALAESEGIELSDEQMEAVAGGNDWTGKGTVDPDKLT